MAEAEQATASDVLTDREAAFEDEDVIRRARKLVEAYENGEETDPHLLAAGAVHAVARDRYTTDEIASAFGIEEKNNISHMRLRFINDLGETYYEYAATPPNVVRDHAEELGDDVVEVAERIFEAWDGWRRSSRGVNTLAAAGAYFAKRANNPEITQEDIADIFGVTDASLRNAQDDIEDDLTEDELMRAIYGEERDIEDTPFEGYSQNHSFRDPEKLAEAREWLDEQEVEVSEEPTATVGDDLRPERPSMVNTTENARLFDVSQKYDRSKLSVNRVADMDSDHESVALTPEEWARVHKVILLHSQNKAPKVKIPERVSINRAKNGDYVVEEYGEYVRLPPQEWVDLLAPVTDQQTRQQAPRQA